MTIWPLAVGGWSVAVPRPSRAEGLASCFWGSWLAWLLWRADRRDAFQASEQEPGFGCLGGKVESDPAGVGADFPGYFQDPGPEFLRFPASGRGAGEREHL